MSFTICYVDIENSVSNNISMPNTNCLICKIEFSVKPNRLIRGWGKYCSRECQYTAMQKGSSYSCATCEKVLYRTPRDLRKAASGRFFCNKSCFAKFKNKLWTFGEDHFNWRGGIYAYRKKMLRGTEKPTCKKCKIDDLRVLVVHHIDQNRKNNSQDNLIWLCRNCHYLEHNHKTI